MAGNRRNRLPIQGKRSKVEIDDSAGKDKSINGFFESAISPEEKKDDNEGRERALMPSNNDLSPPLSPERGMEKQPARAPQENVRLSLLGQKHDSFETGVEEDRHVGAPRISKWTSPSDLSRVSTLPPTPGAGLQKQAEIAEDVELLRHAGAEDELHENPMVEEPEDFPQPDDDDDGDDLAPPIMDDDDDESRAEEQGTEEHLQAEKKLSDTESENNDEDGEKEAAGIELAPEDDENEMVEEEEEEEEEQPKKRRGRKKKARVSFDSEEQTPARKPRKKRAKRGPFSPKGIPAGNHGFYKIPIVEASPDDAGGLRRSKRMRTKPLEFWRNEYVEYQPASPSFVEECGDIPVPANLVYAEETPYRKRKESKKPKATTKSKKAKAKAGKRKKYDDIYDDDDDDDDETFDATELKKEYKNTLKDGELANIWDAGLADIDEQRIIARSARLKAVANFLVPIDDMPPEEARQVGKAAQAFNTQGDASGERTGFIMGNLTLPPGGKKQAESVGPCVQTFTVFSGQKQSLELVFAHPDCDEAVIDDRTAQRYLLGPGDLFYIPPGNTYRLQNHSEKTPCKLTWTIIRPREHFLPGAMGNEEDVRSFGDDI
eukprot:CAMPEP_0176023374 /NCGR_PEP_ID=MMETSP0120_2-20121206/11402_1 /TAXON_ID=160619 /ORGANISM="Kryptoperidinium foliaceum, Strain CCMP 1326" /LENGTH=602 /DNA_ID=CAMNT_0017356537 /DNA_START=84 /DNA_END=1892 /DNA_ORIENTATION=+